MKNRVHYGEFTLDYWLEQLVSGGIVLPEYQRSFVWSKEQIKNLINSISRDEFVPPVTIGKLNDKNIIIDGQQRLTSIALAYLNIVPNERRYKKTVKVEGDNEDDELEEEHYFEWTINTLKELGTNINEIKKALIDNQDYETLGTHWVNDEFLKKHYLGFSYIIPHTETLEDARHRFFSTIFRNVNIGGTNLLKTESRTFNNKVQELSLINPELYAKFIRVRPYKPKERKDINIRGFVIETLTVIIQITSVVIFKRKVFLMTPIHHHFERLGWSETDIVKLFWIVGFILCLIALIYGVWL